MIRFIQHLITNPYLRNKYAEFFGLDVSPQERLEGEWVHNFYVFLKEKNCLVLGPYPYSSPVYQLLVRETIKSIKSNQKLGSIYLVNVPAEFVLEIIQALPQARTEVALCLENIQFTEAQFKKLTHLMHVKTMPLIQLQLINLCLLECTPIPTEKKFEAIDMVDSDGTVIVNETEPVPVLGLETRKKPLSDYPHLLVHFFWRASKDWPQLMSLTLKFSEESLRLDDEVGLRVFNSLGGLQYLEALSLVDVGMSAQSSIALAQLVARVPIKTLNISFQANHFKDINAHVMRAENNFLLNKIGTALRTNHQLIELSLNSCFLTSKYLEGLLCVLPNSGVTLLELKGNFIGPVGLDLLKKYAEIYQAKIRINTEDQGLLLAADDDIEEYIPRNLPSTLLNLLPHSANTTTLFESVIEAVRCDRDAYTLYFKLSNELLSFYSGAHALLSKLCDMSSTGWMNQGSQALFELCEKTSLISVSSSIYFVRCIVKNFIQAHQEEDLRELIYLIAPEHNELLIKLLPALLAVMYWQKTKAQNSVHQEKLINWNIVSVKEVDSVELLKNNLLQRILAAWGNVASINILRKGALARIPDIWLMEIIRQVVDVDGDLGVTELFQEAWGNLNAAHPEIYKEQVKDNLIIQQQKAIEALTQRVSALEYHSFFAKKMPQERDLILRRTYSM